jgi:hypothetical protein
LEIILNWMERGLISEEHRGYFAQTPVLTVFGLVDLGLDLL